MKNTLLLLFFAIAFTACNKQPIANFYYDKNTYTAGETIHLIDASSDAKHWLWTMPDGTTFTTQNVDYIIPDNDRGGTKSIKLEVTSRSGKKSSSFSKQIEITQVVYSTDFYSLDTYIIKPALKQTYYDGKNWIIKALLSLKDKDRQVEDKGLIIIVPGSAFSFPSSGTYFLNSNAISQGEATINITIDANWETFRYCVSDSGKLNVLVLPSGQIEYSFSNIYADNKSGQLPVSGTTKISGDIITY